MSYIYTLSSDAEKINGAASSYSMKNITTSESLDSSIFGTSDVAREECKICGAKTIEECPKHYCYTTLPFSVPNLLMLSELKKIISCICPICSRIFLPEDLLIKIKELNPEFRLPRIRTEIQNLFQKNTNLKLMCPRCHHEITSTIEYRGVEPALFFVIMDPSSGTYKNLDPNVVYEVLQNFTELEEIGISECAHPKNYMSNILVITPTQLRAKSLDTPSTATLDYNKIIVEIVPKLQEIKTTMINSNVSGVIISKLAEQKFIEQYTLLMCYYMRICDIGTDNTNNAILKILGKRDKTHYDASTCLIRKLKGKDHTIFGKGIRDFVHDGCCRVVLGPAVDNPSHTIGLPTKIANQLSMYYPVYQENLRFIKNLILAMKDLKIYEDPSTPKIYGVKYRKTGRFQKFTIQTADSIAALISPGDQLSLTLMNYDMVMQNRHPCIREECCTNLMVIKSPEGETLQLPVQICPVKSADFDGDEIQAFVPADHTCDVEEFLLHSVFRQYRNYVNSAFSFDFSNKHDTGLGLQRLNMINKDTKIKYFNHKLHNEGVNVFDEIEKVLPKNLNFTSEKLIIKNGKIDPNHHNFANEQFFKYYSQLFGTDRACQLMDKIIAVGYDLNRNFGSTFGYEIRFFGKPEEWKKINELKDKAEEEAREIIRKEGQMTLKAYGILEEPSREIKKIGIEAAQGQNIQKMGYLDSKGDEYISMIGSYGFMLMDDGFIKSTMANGTRPNSGEYRWSCEPRAYGYIKRGLVYDLPPEEVFIGEMNELKGNYDKYVGTATQGYLSNKLGISNDFAYADYNGCLVSNNFLISSQYGTFGIDPRFSNDLPLIDLDLNKDEFNKKYSDDKKLQTLHEFITEIQKLFKQATFVYDMDLNNSFVSGFDFESLFKSYGTKGTTDIKEINKLIDELFNLYCPKKLQNNILQFENNFINHEYYFRIKLHEFKLNDDLRNLIIKCFLNMFVNAGELVGLKSALAISCLLTQANLSSIHGKHGSVNADNVNRPNGNYQFAVLLDGKKHNAEENKSTVLSIFLYDDSYENCAKFCAEQETFYFNEIWIQNSILIQNQIPEELLNFYDTDSFNSQLLKQIKHSPYVIKSIWDLETLAIYNIKISTIISNLMKLNPDILFMLPYYLNESQIYVYIYFKEKITLTQIVKMTNTWNQTKANNLVHGKYIKHCYIRELTTNPGHYCIECNESNPAIKALENLIYHPDVNPVLSKTNNPKISNAIYGCFEGCIRQYELLRHNAIHFSSTSKIFHKCLKTVASVSYLGGSLSFVNSSSLEHNIKPNGENYRSGMTMLAFEKAKNFLIKLLKTGATNTMGEYLDSNVFGRIPTMGSGVSEFSIGNFN